MSSRDTQIQFQEQEQEVRSVFLLEDLIKEYNHKIVSNPSSIQKGKIPLSLIPIKENSGGPFMHPTLNDSSNHLVIRPMTQEEINTMRNHNLKGNDWAILRDILREQIEPKGLIYNTPNISQGVLLIHVINELGLKGKVYYKTTGEKTYVILKGFSGNRTFLKGTRYLSENPDVVRFGLGQTNIRNLFRSGFKTSIWI